MAAPAREPLRTRRRFEPAPLVLCMVVAAFDLPYLADRVVPVVDTFYSFVNFHVFYGQFFYHDDLARWYPYGVFGLPSQYEQLISLSPASYAIGLVGALLRVPDALLLFKLSVVVEHAIFVFGVFLLARRLFPSRTTAWLLGLAAAGTVVWHAQLWYQLRFFYLFPLVLFFAISFLEDAQPARLWLAGITGVAWALGNLPYYLPIWALVLVVVLAPVAQRSHGVLGRALRRPPSHLALLAVFLAAAGAYLHFASHSLDGILLLGPGRDPKTGRAALEFFLTYGGNPDLAIIGRSMVFGWPLFLPVGSGVDNSVYLGLLPLVAFAVAVARERAPLFLGICAAAFLLVVLSLGGSLARTVYHLPLMSYYRHVGLVYGLVKVLVLVGGGYGLERLRAHGLPRPRRSLLLIGAAVSLGATAVLLPEALEGVDAPARSGDPWRSHLLLRLSVYATLVSVGLAFARTWRPAFALALALALALDLALFQLAVFERHAPRVEPSDAPLLAALEIRPLRFQPVREHPPPHDPMSRLALELATRPGGGENLQWVTYAFAQFDPCLNAFHRNFGLHGVERLRALVREHRLDPDSLLGCGTPKLRLDPEARVVRTTLEARKVLLAAVGSGTADTVVRLPGKAVLPNGVGTAGDRGEGGAGSVRVSRFTHNEIAVEAQVEAPAGSWLVYLDAYHPGWRASVNGRETPVAKANLAFKAIWLPTGPSAVRFWFDPGLAGLLGDALAGFGAAFTFGLGALLIATTCGFRIDRRL